MPELRLSGCRSRPLLSYLKALGVLRIVAEQADEDAAGRWQGGVFELRSALSEDELTEFFLDRYEPSPVVSPWNGGSGFHPGDRKHAIERLEARDESRFSDYRQTIESARGALSELGLDGKPADDHKLGLVREMRRRAPDAALEWLDAAIVVVSDSTAYPPLLGSGGNDGRYDFSNNFAHAVVACLVEADRGDTENALRAALFGGEVELQRKLSLGHFSRDSSPTNSPQGEADSLGNPWELILAIEGSLLLAAGASRRHGTQRPGALVAPFTVRPTAAGYGSAVAEESGRAELWLPVWGSWVEIAELRALSRESRAQVQSAGRTRSARSGLDFARATGELGVARGIEAFERYAILERAGQSNLAVPAGRIAVKSRSRASTIRELDPWLGRVLGFAERGGPGAVKAAARAAERAAFELAVRDDAESCLGLVVALGQLEEQLARSAEWAKKKGIQPLRGLTAPNWIAAADDGTSEFAVAVALGSLGSSVKGEPSLRDYLHGTSPPPPSDRPFRAFDTRRSHLISANSPVAVLAEIHACRHVDAGRASRKGAREGGESEGGRSAGSKPLPQLGFDRGVWCDLDATRRFAAGLLDDQLIFQLTKGLCLLGSWSDSRPRVEPTDDESVAVPSFDLLALAWAPRASRDDGNEAKESNGSDPDGPVVEPEPREALGARPGWAAKLAAGASEQVVRDACLRLRMAGLPPLLRPEDLLIDAPPGPRLAAALLLRIRPGDLKRLGNDLTTWNEDELTTRTESDTEESNARRPR